MAALRSALAVDPASSAAGLEPRHHAPLDLRIRIVSADYVLVAKLSGSLAEWGYEVDVCATRAEAAERALYASPHGVIYDYGADPEPNPGSRGASAPLRGSD